MATTHVVVGVDVVAAIVTLVAISDSRVFVHARRVRAYVILPRKRKRHACAFQVQRIAILDLRVFNTDRHADNIMLCDPDTGQHPAGTLEERCRKALLRPIDHEMCLPDYRPVAGTDRTCALSVHMCVPTDRSRACADVSQRHVLSGIGGNRFALAGCFMLSLKLMHTICPFELCKSL